MRGRREQIHLASGQSFRLLRWEDNLREAHSLLADGRTERVSGEGQHWHYHVEMELTQFTSGEGIRFVGDHIGPFAAGDVVLLGPNLPHHWHVRGPSSGLSLQWSFPHGHPFWEFPETFSLGQLFQASARGIRFGGGAAIEIHHHLREMVRVKPLERLSLLFRLFQCLLQCPERERIPLSARAFALPSADLHQQTISEVVRYLLANYREELRLTEVLQLVQMSKPTFARQFRKHAGKTFSDFLTHVRLRAACRELEETDRPVLEIAHASGFSHVSFFNRVFRRILRSNPTRYRSQHKKKSLRADRGRTDSAVLKPPRCREKLIARV